MTTLFQSEREGQIKFFEDLKIAADVELTDNTDGVYRGTLFEFKLTISNIDRTLQQAIKYLSRRRIKGRSVPQNILLVSLCTQTAYLFNSENFLDDIEKIYVGASSKNNAQFAAATKPVVINYNTLQGLQQLTKILDTDNFTRIHIDIFCAVGWAERFYAEVPQATKIHFFQELRQPKVFADYIYAWNGDEQDFKYIMDCLNDRMHRKELGAFYTPPAYCKQAAQLVRRAIANIPKDHDYIILDRCAGTGNLEEFLTDKNVDDITIGELEKYLPQDIISTYLQDKRLVLGFIEYDNFNKITMRQLEEYKTEMTIRNYLFDNELSHCIVNTYELKEWVVLNTRIGSMVRLIIPPPEDVHTDNSLVNGSDALSDTFVNGAPPTLFTLSGAYYDSIQELNDYVNNPTTNVIMLENPPYRDTAAAGNYNDTRGTTRGFTCFVKKMMKQEVKPSTANDLSNLFIWSAWKYYLKKQDDYYVVFSPVKYWKSCGLADKKFVEGFLLNRQYFHASASAISCILWKNENEQHESILLKVLDINTHGYKIYIPSNNQVFAPLKESVEIKKIYDVFSDVYYDKRKFEDDQQGIYCGRSGEETNVKLQGLSPLYNENIVGYLRANGAAVEPLSVVLTRVGQYNGHGFYLRTDNYLEKLPLFCAKLYPQENWWQHNIYFTTADGGGKYAKDADFLKACLIYTCLSHANKCLSFNGSDGRFYRNELCFDDETLASRQLQAYALTDVEHYLLSAFYAALELGRQCKGYEPQYSYGTYQIDSQLNTRCKDGAGVINYDYPLLNTKLVHLRTELSKYYAAAIKPKLFEYELLK